MALHNSSKLIISFTLRIVLIGLIGLLGCSLHAQKTYDLQFEDGLSTKVTILEDSPSKIPQGCFSFYPFVFGGFGGGLQDGAFGPFSLSLGYWRWTKNRRHLFEGFSMVTPIDSRAMDSHASKYTPFCNAKFNYRFIFAQTDKTKLRKLNFLTDNAYSYNTVIVHRAKMEIQHRRSFAIRAGLNGQLHAMDVARSWYVLPPLIDRYSVDRSLNAFGHIGLSTLKTFFLAYESKAFGGKQQAGKVGEIYADFLFGLGQQAYGYRYHGDPNDPRSSFGAVPRYKNEATIIHLGARFGTEVRYNFARKPRSGALFGFEFGRNPGFLGGNYYGEFRFGLISMGTKKSI